MANEKVRLEIDRGVATITLNRPDKLNAIDPEMGPALDAAFVKVAGDSGVRVVVVTGAGRGFCAGADLGAAKVNVGGYKLRAPPGSPNPVFDQIPRAPLALRGRYTAPAAVPQPVIAAVNGACAGVGFTLAAACDVRFASAEAVFVASFGRRGLTAEGGLAWTLPRLIGVGPAADILLSGRKVDAAEALRLNLVSAVTPAGGVLAHALAYARDIADNVSPRSARIIKQQLRQGLEQSQADAQLSSWVETQSSLESDDAKEGATAFIERRPARFTGS